MEFALDVIRAIIELIYEPASYKVHMTISINARYTRQTARLESWEGGRDYMYMMIVNVRCKVFRHDIS